MNHMNKSTEYWQGLDRAHHLHPFTDAKSLNEKGVRVMTKADGVYLWDSEGNRVLDGMAGLWCVNLGYGRKELVDAAQRQMLELPFYNTFFQTSNIPATELAGLLAEVAPAGMKHAFFANSGSEAVDTAIRMVRRYWQAEGLPERNVIISRNNAYHGSSVAGACLGGMGAMHEQSGLMMPGFEHIMQPYWYQDGGDLSPEEFGLVAARALEERILAVGPEKVAAFIGEPIQGAGGVIVPPDSYWPEIQRICNQYGILLIADEVICGFGRTGNWFGSQTFGFTPDLMTMAKGMSSGYMPISAVMVGERVANTLIEKSGEFYHGYTYSGHPVAAAVAIENIRILKEERIIERVAEDTGPYFQEKLQIFAEHPLVGEVVGRGLVAGMVLVKDKKTRELYENGSDVGTMCRNHCFSNGLIMRACGDRMVLSPPLIISRAEIDEMLDKAKYCLDLAAKDLGKL
ncbi:aspartate aminotransferase family protein [Kiloniella laminariae]|uniref:Aspartate aminotransferase family protein n=1 Tax=Kiloniella laminariae TaxID=454162 RepID=A0ABT4LPH1_9PROT|nr:aspartate aminotransferase family protein [Kiloniella laminariae]MCZ4282795.1 aspartate aminotransferase family protein [Kiloniella laminariae]